MIRLATVLWLVLVAFVGFGMFKVKYEVMDLEDELARANRAIVTDQDAIHVLKAEWAFLAQPSRLAELSRRHLDLVPLGTAQLGQIDAIPLRPGGAMPPAADNRRPTPGTRPAVATTLATRIDP
jgi:cell division protein FtsL